MNNPLDEFGKRVCEKRNEKGLTQRELAEKLGMSHRTIMQIETFQSNPKFETVILLAKYLDISVDAILFPETASPNAISKSAYDFFKGRTESEVQRFVELCKAADELGKNK